MSSTGLSATASIFPMMSAICSGVSDFFMLSWPSLQEGKNRWRVGTALLRANQQQTSNCFIFIRQEYGWSLLSGFLSPFPHFLLLFFFLLYRVGRNSSPNPSTWLWSEGRPSTRPDFSHRYSVLHMLDCSLVLHGPPAVIRHVGTCSPGRPAVLRGSSPRASRRCHLSQFLLMA